MWGKSSFLRYCLVSIVKNIYREKSKISSGLFLFIFMMYPIFRVNYVEIEVIMKFWACSFRPVRQFNLKSSKPLLIFYAWDSLVSCSHAIKCVKFLIAHPHLNNIFAEILFGDFCRKPWFFLQAQIFNESSNEESNINLTYKGENFYAWNRVLSKLQQIRYRKYF